jgi:hypothetical protein
MFTARQQFNYQTPATGGFGNNLFFPANPSQYLSKAGTTNLVTWKATTGYTIEYWGYWTSFYNTINGGPGNQDGSSTNYWSFGPVTNGVLEFYYWGSGQQYFNTTTSVIPLNTWTNIAAVFTTTGTSTTANLYVNGVRQNIQWNYGGTYAQQQTVTNGVVSSGTVFGMGKYSSMLVAGYYNNLRASNINRYSGASYTLATSSFTSDSNTQLLITPTDPAGTTISYQSTAGNGTMTNSGSYITSTITRANHT